MEGSDGEDDRTFKVNFSSDGVTKLRKNVTEKLKEFMGDYTDDTLVEYVIVLIRNGRRKEEAKNELWDHLSSNIDLYMQRESNSGAVPGIKHASGDQGGRSDTQLDSESDRANLAKLSRSRHNREWKGLGKDVTEPPPFRSSVVVSPHVEDENHHNAGRRKRSISPRPLVQKKRGRTDERSLSQREVVSQATVDAPRRLLQFAVRDAVATARPSNLGVGPTLKRLRSVVSTSSGNSSLEDRPQRIRSGAIVPSSMITAMKAAAEAAEDVTRVRSSKNVFDRLGHGTDVLETPDQVARSNNVDIKDREYDDLNHVLEQSCATNLHRKEYSGQYVGKMSMVESDTGLGSDSASDNEGYDDVNIHRVMNGSQMESSCGNKGDDSLMVQYSVAKNAEDVLHKPRFREEDQPAASANKSHKIVNISVNVNTWKPPHYQAPLEAGEANNVKSVQGSGRGDEKSGVQVMGSGVPVTAGNGHVKSADAAKEFPKTITSAVGSYSTIRPSEDADSRTIFVSNVHFAATKDSLSRHFNKFGEVLKVVILTDTATGQPKGSAYVEFMRKEAAEHSLSLDGTSFMYRILKVVKRSSVHQDAASMMTWPRMPRASPFTAGRFARVPFPRGMSSAAFRLRPIKTSARIMQWKRDSQASSENGNALTSNNVASPTARGLTYVRPDAKPGGNTGTT
ncbi:RNA recognition motif domain [Dillenia turbinata]|uniref:RNA recognition motif domain n=1 Tax=Dillenia turbinata TaxID=194707 RepID=A0AAN8V8C4_9MAGN